MAWNRVFLISQWRLSSLKICRICLQNKLIWTAIGAFLKGSEFICMMNVYIYTEIS